MNKSTFYIDKNKKGGLFNLTGEKNLNNFKVLQNNLKNE